MAKVQRYSPMVEDDLAAAAIVQMLSFFQSEQCPFDPKGDLVDFVRAYGLKIDGRPFDFDKYHHLLEVYLSAATWIAIMAGAQSGKSAFIMADYLRAGITRWGSNLGYYFPDNHLPKAFSRARFKPMVNASADLGPWLGRGTMDRDDIDQVQARAFGATTFFFLSVRGTTTTEGLPMGGVWLDEVRRMALGDIQRAEERASAQEDPLYRYVSTAMFPDSDIHALFMRGNQSYYHSECGCPDGIVLSTSWPDCILDLRGNTRMRQKAMHAFEHAGRPFCGTSEDHRAQWGELCYWCPTCGEIITDPRDGWWEPHAPDVLGRESYQLPQLLNPTWPANRVWDFYTQPALHMQEFYNSKLGLPYLDQDTVPCRREHVEASVNPDLVWPAAQSREWRSIHTRNTCMGVDVQKGYLVAVVKQRGPSGKYRTVHVEVCHVNRGANDPWPRLALLMQEFDVRLAVIDEAPEFSAARKFAQAFRGRVFLAHYVEGDPTAPLVTWKDAQNAASQRGDARFPFTVTINRTPGLQWSLSMWKQGDKEIPPLKDLHQLLPTADGQPKLSSNLAGGTWQRVRIADDLYVLHLTRVAIIRHYPESDPDGQRLGQYKLKAEHIGLDPHFAHAELYADAALSRLSPPRLTA